METLTQFLIDWGYWGLFFSALIAGSVVPFSSEAVMLVLVHMGLDPVLCVVSAASGNTLGGMSCYWIGTLGKSEWITQAGRKRRNSWTRPAGFSQGAGRVMAFFSFLPDHRRSHRHRPRPDAQQRLAHGRLDARRQDTALYRRAGDFPRCRIASLNPQRMEFEIVKTDTPDRSLLLLADESEESVADYADRGTTYAACQSGQLLGQYVLLHTRPFTAEVVNIAVAPEYQRRGIATTLLQHAVRTARDAGFRLLEIGTGRHRRGADRPVRTVRFRPLRHRRRLLPEALPRSDFRNGVECRHMVRLRMELR